ncbi:MAG TPA: chloride channel protein [Ktedonobacterales bacterium]
MADSGRQVQGSARDGLDEATTELEAGATRAVGSTPRGGSGQRSAFHLGDFVADRRLLFICAIAVVVGALGALIAVILMMLIGLITNALYYHRLSTTLVSPAANSLGWWAVPIPIIGGLIIGVMARYGSERIRGHGIPEAMETILVGGSKVEPRLAVLKPISSAISIGTGGPFGAEGPIILTGGAVGSVVGQLLHLTAAERKTLLVAGAAAGMAATFNAPVAAVLLAVELLLFEWRPRSLVPVAIASAVATVLRWHAIGRAAIFPIGLHPQADGSIVLGAALVGLVAGGLAWALTLGVYGAEDLFRKLPIHWMWWPALGGIIVGVGGVFFPRALGVGYDTIASELSGSLTLKLLLGIIIAKSVIWCMALGSGTSGGILAPLLLIGGALGGIEGAVLPGHSPALWALIGMSAALAGVTRSPLTSVIFAVELTLAYDALLPLLVACVVAHLVSVLVLRRSILTEKVARRGFHVTREYAVDPLETLMVDEVMQTDIITFDVTLPIVEAAESIAERSAVRAQRLYPILDETAALIGVVSRSDLATRDGASTATLAAVVRRSFVSAHPDETLRVITNRMIATGFWRLPVVSRDDPHTLLGLITQRELFRARELLLIEERQRERVLIPRLLTIGRQSASTAERP